MSVDGSALSDAPTEQHGRRALALLDDPVLAEAFARLEQDLIAAWRGSRPVDREVRERLYLRLGALDAIRQELRLIVEEGRLAERERLVQLQDSETRRAAGLAAGDPP